MDESKPIWQSKAVIGSLVAIAAGVFGVADNTDEAQATELIVGLVTAIAGLVALIGRLVAKKRIVKPRIGA